MRDSTLDQRDGFGPDIQRHNIERFSEIYGVILSDDFYTEFVSGRSVAKRGIFTQMITDAQVDVYDVILVDHTSRFGRNQEDCIKYKAVLRELDRVVVFVSQGIISGSDRDFLNERINETMDEAYGRNLSRYISAGLTEKASQGLANGKPPLGYRSQKLENGKRERKIPDPDTIPALVELLRSYASGNYSYQTLANHLNAQGYRTRLGQPFTSGSVEHVLQNRFYEGKAVFHPGRLDEEVEVRDGVHEAPDNIKELWLVCQEVKRRRTKAQGRGQRAKSRAYPFSGILTCDESSSGYKGLAKYRDDNRVLRKLIHKRSQCTIRPRTQRIEAVSDQFSERVLTYMSLPDDFVDTATRAFAQQNVQPDHQRKVQSLD